MTPPVLVALAALTCATPWVSPHMMAVQTSNSVMAVKDEDAFHWAVTQDNVKEVRRRLDAGIPVDYRFKAGLTLLQLCVLSGADQSAQLLVQRGAQADIFAAAALGDVGRVERLLATDRTLATSEVGSVQPLYLAARNGRTEIARTLVRHGACLCASTDTGMPIHAAVSGGHTETVRALVELGSSLKWEDTRGLVPAHYARSAAMLKVLIDLGFSPAYETSKGVSILDTAAASLDMERVKLLVEYDLPKAQLNTALHSCATAGEHPAAVKVAELLIAAGAALDARAVNGGHGATVLHTATAYGGKTLCAFFLRKGVDVNARDHSGRTALHYAALGGDRALCDLLTQYGASWEDRDASGITPADLLKGPGRE